MNMLNCVAETIPPLWSWFPGERHLYFMTSGPYIKVGISDNPERRRMELLHPDNETILPDDFNGEIRLVAHVAGNSRDEAEIHREFAHCHVKGEWFMSTPELREEMTLALFYQAKTELKLKNLNIAYLREHGATTPLHDLNNPDVVALHAKAILERPPFHFSERLIREAYIARHPESDLARAS